MARFPPLSSDADPQVRTNHSHANGTSHTSAAGRASRSPPGWPPGTGRARRPGCPPAALGHLGLPGVRWNGCRVLQRSVRPAACTCWWKTFPLAVVAKVYWASQEACSYRHVLASLAKMISGAPGASGSASTSATARAHVGRSMSSIRSWFRTDLLIVIVRRL